MMNNLYYDNPAFALHNGKYYLYLCEGQRGRGKTTYWLQRMVEDSIRTGKKFVYLRRSEVELELALEKGLYNGCQTVEANKPFWAKIKSHEEKNGELKLTDYNGQTYVIGYYMTLNNVKGVSVEDCDKMLFDEYVAETRSKYKGGEAGTNEPTLFLRLCETLFRRREFYCVLLGNQDTPSNPYNEYFRVPFKTQLYKDKSRGLWYEYDYSTETAEAKEKTTLGIIAKNTAYSNYSMGLKALNEIDEALVREKPAHSKQLYNIKILGNTLTAWLDGKDNVLYITDNCKINSSLPIISVTNNDMSVNTDFIKYASVFTQVMVAFHGRGCARFNSQKTASLFATMLSLN